MNRPLRHFGVNSHATLIHLAFLRRKWRNVIARNFWLTMANDVRLLIIFIVSQHEQCLRTDLLLFSWVLRISHILTGTVFLQMLGLLISSAAVCTILISFFRISIQFQLFWVIDVLVEDWRGRLRWRNLSLATLLIMAIRSLIPYAVPDFLIKLRLFWLILVLKLFWAAAFALVHVFIIIQIQLITAFIILLLNSTKKQSVGLIFSI